MQNQYNGINDNNNIKFLLLYIRKIQNTIFGILTIDKTALLIKTIANKKRLDINIRKINYKIS